MQSQKFKIHARVRWDKGNSKDGYPIAFRCIVNGVESWVFTSHRISDKKQWNSKARVVVKRADADQLNAIITNEKKAIKANLLNEIENGQEISKASIRGKRLESFNAYAKVICKDTPTTRYRLNRIKKCIGKEPVITEITAEWARNLQHTMLKGIWDEKKKKTIIFDHNTMVTTMKLIQHVCNTAEDDGYIKKSPFGKHGYLVPKPKDKDRTWLDGEERAILLNGLIDPQLNEQIRNYFTEQNKKKGQKKVNPEIFIKVLTYFNLGVYAGFRRSDWLKFNTDINVRGDYVYLRTTKFNKEVVYWIDDELASVINVIRKVGPLTHSENVVDKYLKIIGKYFKINKKFTTHVARHSFGARQAELGTPVSDCALFMGIGVVLCERVYYHVTGKMIADRYKRPRTVQLLPAA